MGPRKTLPKLPEGEKAKNRDKVDRIVPLCEADRGEEVGKLRTL
jgi:hypothetical protein